MLLIDESYMRPYMEKENKTKKISCLDAPTIIQTALMILMDESYVRVGMEKENKLIKTVFRRHSKEFIRDVMDGINIIIEESKDLPLGFEEFFKNNFYDLLA